MLVDVAAQTRIAHGTVLHHFGTIDEVGAALMEGMFHRPVEQILEGRKGVAAGRPSQTELPILFSAFEFKGVA